MYVESCRAGKTLRTASQKDPQLSYKVQVRHVHDVRLQSFTLSHNGALRCYLTPAFGLSHYSPNLICRRSSCATDEHQSGVLMAGYAELLLWL